jgi:membrane protein YqaA with SNARE-associated domain
MEEAYKLLFQDSLLSALIYPFDNELLFDVMVYFGGYDTTQVVGFAMAASVTGFLINYTIGRVVYSSRSIANLTKEDEKKFQVAVGYAQKYGVYILLLNFHPLLGPLATFLAGMVNVRPLIFISLIIVGRVGYYAYFLVLNGTI